MALVVDAQDLLCGLITDGDIRRGMLRGLSMDSSVTEIMTREPHRLAPDENRDALLRLLELEGIRHAPVVEEDGKVVGLIVRNEPRSPPPEGTLVVLMAGGLGTRLSPLTDNLPKPMLELGGRPILETIIRGLQEKGFSRFALSVNYRAEMIRAHFGDGSALGVEIEYLQEDMPLGTAGSLGLLPKQPSGPFVVMNGDLLTGVNFGRLLESHTEAGALATMCVREYTVRVPYGVVDVEDDRIQRLREKPAYRELVNAGIYVLEPEVLEIVRPRKHLDMTTLFNALLARGEKVVAFAIREYWRDIGHSEDLNLAREEFKEHFS
jgi:NDP-sugar pyrophosphorylase family protein